MEQNYIALHLSTEDEIVIALLSQYDFESFEEKQGETIAYISEASYLDQKEYVTEILENREVSYTEELIKPQNWNATWEASFTPVVIDDFCVIRALFHDPLEGIEHEILIDPKMAFGTGHHQTTHMMIESMRDIDFTGAKVFDYGCGTGILSVLASKLNAETIDAIDIEEASFENTLENAELNNIQNINAKKSTLETFELVGYDVILANINRGVLLHSAHTLYQGLNEQGTILLSGLLEDDIDIVKSKYLESGFEFHSLNQREDWICMKFTK